MELPKGNNRKGEAKMKNIARTISFASMLLFANWAFADTSPPFVIEGMLVSSDASSVTLAVSLRSNSGVEVFREHAQASIIFIAPSGEFELATDPRELVNRGISATIPLSLSSPNDFVTIYVEIVVTGLRDSEVAFGFTFYLAASSSKFVMMNRRDWLSQRSQSCVREGVPADDRLESGDTPGKAILCDPNGRCLNRRKQ